MTRKNIHNKLLFHVVIVEKVHSWIKKRKANKINKSKRRKFSAHPDIDMEED